MPYQETVENYLGVAPIQRQNLVSTGVGRKQLRFVLVGVIVVHHQHSLASSRGKSLPVTGPFTAYASRAKHKNTINSLRKHTHFAVVGYGNGLRRHVGILRRELCGGLSRHGTVFRRVR